MVSLFLLPHPDDELFMLPRVMHDLELGRRVHFAYLTDGAQKNATPERRRLESLRCLASLGIAADRLHFIGIACGIPDASLIHHLDRAYPALVTLAKQIEATSLYFPAWEGGHPDHDAASALGTRLAQDRSAEARSFFLYNGYRSRGPLFRVALPVPTSQPYWSRKLPFSQRWRALVSFLYFTSQIKSLLPLLPEFALRLLTRGTETLGSPTLELLRTRPHEGRLLYERHGRAQFSLVREQVDRFLAGFH